MLPDETIIKQTKKWVIDVVVGCNFCPFAAREIKRASIHYEVLHTNEVKPVLESLARAFLFLDENPLIETTLLILPDAFTSFGAYLDLVDISGSFLEREGYEGIYQLASFHPLYIFKGSDNNDPANFTNRSPYPMLHLLREASVTKAVDNFPGTENIPQKNISFSTEKGLEYMQSLKEACMDVR